MKKQIVLFADVTFEKNIIKNCLKVTQLYSKCLKLSLLGKNKMTQVIHY